MAKRDATSGPTGPSTADIVASLRSSESQLRLIFDNITDIVYMVDVEDDGYRFAAVNRRFLEATGLASGQVVGRRVEEVIPEPSLGLVLARYARALQQGGPVHWEETTNYPVGTRHGEVMVAPVADADGRYTRLVGTVHDITDRRHAEARLHRLAHFDGLTGLPNRSHLYSCLEKELHPAAEQGRILVLLYIGIDGFKGVNDALGHAAGDELLRQVAERVLGCVRVRDIVGRFGGDEFGVVASISTQPDDAVVLARKLLAEIRRPLRLADHDVAVTASIGISVYPADADAAEPLVRFADTAMHHAKEAGGNAYRFYTPRMNHWAQERRELEAALRMALERGEFRLHFQPQVALPDGACMSVEALLRWQRPGRGMVMPNDFIPVLEDTGLIVPVGRWVVDEACRQIAEWRRAGLDGMRVSVNISACQILPCREGGDLADGQPADGSHAGRGSAGANLAGHVEDCLRRHGVPAGSLRVELTESTLMSDAGRTNALLARLKHLGLQVAVDDFGTGYSSLAYLKRFPIDILKIDREFIRALPRDAEDVAITRAIIGLAHSLRLEVIAEGVETAEQRDFLVREGCDQAQGYYFARPMPPSELLPMLARKVSPPPPPMA